MFRLGRDKLRKRATSFGVDRYDETVVHSRQTWYAFRSGRHTMLYVGVDAHKATSQITVMDESGKIVKRKRIPSSAIAVREVLKGYQEPLKAVVEASYSWAPMYDWLDEVADEVLLAHPLKVRAIADARIKTDEIDSETLAHLLRADLIPRAHASSKDTRGNCPSFR